MVMSDDVTPPPIPDLRARDRVRRLERLALTPRERLAAMQRLIDEAWRVLEVLSRHGVPFVVIGLDLFDYVPGFPKEPVTAVWETGVELDGIRFASLEWLRRMKKAAGRPKDLLDLENLPDSGAG